MSTASERGPVLITGCSSGLGRAAAQAFHAAGWAVFASARNPSDIEDLRQLGCETLTLDVTDEASRAAAIALIEERHGAVGVLVNNAGIGQYGPLEEVPLDAARRAIETNVLGVIGLTQRVLPAMRRVGRGRIINVSSVAGRVTAAGGGVYHITKYAVEAIADALRPEVKPFGIDVINVLPGPFQSAYGEKVVASIPDTGPESPYLIFKRSLKEFMLGHLRPGGFGVMTCEQVARTILRAASAPKPRTRYNIGIYAKFGPFGRAIAPDRMVDAYMARTIRHR